MVGVLMAKKATKQSARNKARQEPGFRTLGMRVSDSYAEWLAKAAKHDRVTVAAFLDRAAADRAAAIGFTEPPPDRVP